VLLAIDVGNTNTVIGSFLAAELSNSWRIPTDSRTTADQMMLTYRGLLEDQPELTGLALCASVPAVLHEMRLMFQRYFPDVPQVIVEPGTKTGVSVKTDNPREVGARQYAGGFPPLRRPGDRGGLRDVHQPRRGVGIG